MKKRILQIIPELDRSGTSKQIVLLARGLPRDQFDVQVCLLASDGPHSAALLEGRIPVAGVGRRWRLDPLAWWRLRRHVLRLGPDLIHTWLPDANLYGRAVAGERGLPHVVVGQPWIARPGRWLEAAAEGHAARHASALVVSSPAAGDLWMRRGLSAERIAVIPHGVPAATPGAMTRGQVLAELRLPARSRLVGLVGRLLLQERIKDAIWAADLLKVVRDDVHLLIVGEGPHRDRLRKFRDQCLIGDRVHFLGDRGDAARLLPHFDVLWSTRASHAQSAAIMEAMAAGVPVVAAEAVESRELVAPERTGYLVALGDRAAMARHTNRLLDNAGLAERFAEAAKERIRREFSVEKMVHRHVELYRRLLG